MARSAGWVYRWPRSARLTEAEVPTVSNCKGLHPGWEAPRRFRSSVLRSSSLRPPQTPSTPVFNAQSRQAFWTWQLRQTRRACSTWACAGTPLPIGKNSSGWFEVQAASWRQSSSAPFKFLMRTPARVARSSTLFVVGAAVHRTGHARGRLSPARRHRYELWIGPSRRPSG